MQIGCTGQADKGSQSQNHICCGFAQQLLSSFQALSVDGEYKITRQQFLFLVSETSVICYSASPPKNKAQFVFPSLSSPSITPRATLAMKSAEPSVQTFSQQGDQGVNLT